MSFCRWISSWHHSSERILSDYNSTSAGALSSRGRLSSCLQPSQTRCLHASTLPLAWLHYSSCNEMNIAIRNPSIFVAHHSYPPDQLQTFSSIARNVLRPVNRQTCDYMFDSAVFHMQPSVCLGCLLRTPYCVIRLPPTFNQFRIAEQVSLR